MSFPYETSFLNAFPILPVTLQAITEEAKSVSTSALLDTGADATLVPITYLKAIQAKEVYQTQLRMHWGEPHTVIVYLVDLIVAGQRLPAIDVVSDDYADQLLLGRNVLNKLILLLNGPNHQTDVLETHHPLA